MLYEDETKKLVKMIKNVVFEFIRVNRLINRDIKITITNKKTKIVFLKNIK